jgi:hypothetical protein
MCNATMGSECGRHLMDPTSSLRSGKQNASVSLEI